MEPVSQNPGVTLSAAKLRRPSQIALALDRSKSDLLSGFPRQETGSFLEWLRVAAPEIERIRKDMDDQIRIIREEDRKNLVRLLEGETLTEELVGSRRNEKILEEGVMDGINRFCDPDYEDGCWITRSACDPNRARAAVSKSSCRGLEASTGKRAGPGPSLPAPGLRSTARSSSASTTSRTYSRECTAC